MPQSELAKGNASEVDDSASHAGLWWILILGGLLLAALLFASILLPNLSERVKFFTVNAMSLSVLVAIVVQAYIYRRQWKVMTDSLVYSQRAYVTVPKGNINFIADQRYFTLQVANSGNSPANNVLIGSKIEFRSSAPDVTDFNEFANCSRIGLIGSADDIGHGSDPIIPTAAQKPQIEAGTLRLYCWGLIGYQDIFGKNRTTKFSLAQDKWRPSRFGPCEAGNEAN